MCFYLVTNRVKDIEDDLLFWRVCSAFRMAYLVLGWCSWYWDDALYNLSQQSSAQGQDSVNKLDTKHF